jgi:hypothetical protein
LGVRCQGFGVRCQGFGVGAPCGCCHSERSEESRRKSARLGLVLKPKRICSCEILRFAQNDKGERECGRGQSAPCSDASPSLYSGFRLIVLRMTKGGGVAAIGKVRGWGLRRGWTQDVADGNMVETLWGRDMRGPGGVAAIRHTFYIFDEGEACLAPTGRICDSAVHGMTMGRR